METKSFILSVFCFQGFFFRNGFLSFLIEGEDFNFFFQEKGVFWHIYRFFSKKHQFSWQKERDYSAKCRFYYQNKLFTSKYRLFRRNSKFFVTAPVFSKIIFLNFEFITKFRLCSTKLRLLLINQDYRR